MMDPEKEMGFTESEGFNGKFGQSVISLEIDASEDEANIEK